jgi:septal ring factor EnvC (AmiA/AmiB activator)
MSEETNVSKVTLDTIQQSIESLAIATAKGFSSVNNRLDRVETDIVEIKTDIVEMKSDIVEIKTDITGIKQRLTGLDNRLDNFIDHERRLT